MAVTGSAKKRSQLRRLENWSKLSIIMIMIITSMSTHFGVGVSLLKIVGFCGMIKILLSFLGDDDMDAEEKRDVKVLHPKFGRD